LQLVLRFGLLCWFATFKKIYDHSPPANGITTQELESKLQWQRGPARRFESGKWPKVIKFALGCKGNEISSLAIGPNKLVYILENYHTFGSQKSCSFLFENNLEITNKFKFKYYPIDLIYIENRFLIYCFQLKLSKCHPFN